MKTPRTLALTALATVALLLSTATPTAANGPFPIDVIAGTFTHALGVFDMTPGSQGSPPCTEKPATLAMSFDGTAGSGTWTISGTKPRQTQLPVGYPNMPWYQVDVTYLPGSGGTYAAVGSPPPTDTLAGTIGVQIRIYLLQNPGGPLTCAKTNLRCIITGAFAVTDGDFVGNPLPNPLPGDLLDLTSSGNLVTSSCAPPFSSLSSTSATLDQDIQFQ